MSFAFIILAGLFCIIASISNWDWFFNNYRARGFVNLFTRDGARIFYSIIGLAMIIFGIYIYFGSCPSI